VALTLHLVPRLNFNEGDVMKPRELIERLVPEVTRNASVGSIDERSNVYRVTPG
jgi:hypothetical protein